VTSTSIRNAPTGVKAHEARKLLKYPVVSTSV
jgi:hypothetical protein